ncbi:FecR family protein [Chitinophaga niastensis]|uniref:FecR family protein n=1 Tax=Chitinophaga niastensis TaxID=536980 RepID=A0A2P8HCG8_CHINA|nr:FecR family protein [Chitinophaga niastensis]PSL43919.1 FecR family protein [Chitinophaga niastensis]
MEATLINEFLIKFAENRHTEAEHKLFIGWLKSAPIADVQEVMDRYQQIAATKADYTSGNRLALIQKIEARLDTLSSHDDISVPEQVSWWHPLRRVAAAAVLLVLAAAAAFYFLPRHNSAKAPVAALNPLYKNDVAPGGNKAVLILANGVTILLDSAQNGTIASEGHTAINKTKDGEIIYEAGKGKADAPATAYNTIVTPKGGQFQVTLPDGSKVWLNAGSSLKFPPVFNGKERLVELTGEAYFEVAKNAAMPFKVTAGNQTVAVLGTHFNINAYTDEKNSRTTLLEGSVKILHAITHRSQLLKPGQQAKVGDDILVSNVDAGEAIQWKNGYFNFSHEDIESIMRKVARWYDVDIQYEGNITKEEFVGATSRFEKVSEVLDMLQLTGLVHFKINGRRITVMP